MDCYVCQKKLAPGEGFVANVNNQGKALDEGEVGIAVCGEDCKLAFQKSLSSNGKPLYHLSRITGYVQIVDNWNEGKKQEFKDRTRFKV